MKRIFFLLTLISPFFGTHAQTLDQNQDGDPIRYEQNAEMLSSNPILERNLLQVAPAGDPIEGN